MSEVTPAKVLPFRCKIHGFVSKNFTACPGCLAKKVGDREQEIAVLNRKNGLLEGEKAALLTPMACGHRRANWEKPSTDRSYGSEPERCTACQGMREATAKGYNDGQRNLREKAIAVATSLDDDPSPASQERKAMLLMAEGMCRALGAELPREPMAFANEARGWRRQ